MATKKSDIYSSICVSRSDSIDGMDPSQHKYYIKKYDAKVILSSNLLLPIEQQLLLQATNVFGPMATLNQLPSNIRQFL